MILSIALAVLLIYIVAQRSLLGRTGRPSGTHAIPILVVVVSRYTHTSQQYRQYTGRLYCLGTRGRNDTGTSIEDTSRAKRFHRHYTGNSTIQPAL